MMPALADFRAHGSSPAFGMDEGGMMNAMGLGWVVMRPEGHRPLIRHKSGGLQGEFSFLAMAPNRSIGVFVSMNEFSVAGFDAMAKATLGLRERRNGNTRDRGG